MCINQSFMLFLNPWYRMKCMSPAAYYIVNHRGPISPLYYVSSNSVGSFFLLFSAYSLFNGTFFFRFLFSYCVHAVGDLMDPLTFLQWYAQIAHCHSSSLNTICAYICTFWLFCIVWRYPPVYPYAIGLHTTNKW